MCESQGSALCYHAALWRQACTPHEVVKYRWVRRRGLRRVDGLVGQTWNADTQPVPSACGRSDLRPEVEAELQPVHLRVCRERCSTAPCAPTSRRPRSVGTTASDRASALGATSVASALRKASSGLEMSSNCRGAWWTSSRRFWGLPGSLVCQRRATPPLCPTESVCGHFPSSSWGTLRRPAQAGSDDVPDGARRGDDTTTIESGNDVSRKSTDRQLVGEGPSRRLRSPPTWPVELDDAPSSTRQRAETQLHHRVSPISERGDDWAGRGETRATTLHARS